MEQTAIENSKLVENSDVDESQLIAQLVQLRNEKGWTQEELARRAGIEPRTLQKVEGGARVKFATLQAVARALGYNLERLYYLRKK